MSERFAKTLARVIGRVPSHEEISEALDRITELAEVLGDIRAGREGMRREDAPLIENEVTPAEIP